MDIQEYVKTQELISSYCKIWAIKHSDKYVSSVSDIQLENEHVFFYYQGSYPGIMQSLTFPAKYLEMKKEDFAMTAMIEGSACLQFKRKINKLTQSIKSSSEFQKLEKLYNSKGQNIDITILN